MYRPYRKGAFKTYFSKIRASLTLLYEKTLLLRFYLLHEKRVMGWLACVVGGGELQYIFFTLRLKGSCLYPIQTFLPQRIDTDILFLWITAFKTCGSPPKCYCQVKAPPNNCSWNSKHRRSYHSLSYRKFKLLAAARFLCCSLHRSRCCVVCERRCGSVVMTANIWLQRNLGLWAILCVYLHIFSLFIK